MPKTKISEWSSTPANNTDIDSINIAEGCAPSGINDAIRELMSQVKDLYAGTSGDIIAVAAGGTGVGTSTGSGNNVLSTSPTLVTPILGTPTSATLTNATGLPIATGVSGLGTGVATFLATPSSANLAAALTDETGSGANVFATSPTLVTPILGTPTSATLTNATGLPLTTGVTGTLPTANGGTNLTSFTSGGVVYASSSSVLATNSNITFDGTKLNATALSFSYNTSYYNTDNSISNYSSGNYLYVSGNAGATSGLYLQGAGNQKQTIILDGNASGGNIVFQTNGSEALRLTPTSLYTASGINVGIGTSSPAVKLDVQAALGAIKLTSTTGTNIAYYQTSNTGGDLYIGRDSSAGNSFYSGSPAYGSVFMSTGAYPMAFATNSLERMRIDSAGNLGLGVTPSAWDTGNSVRALQMNAGSFWSYTTDALAMAQNSYYNGTNYIYSITSAATQYVQIAGQHRWFNAASGTAGNAISFTQAMTLDASGNLFVGTTSSTNLQNNYSFLVGGNLPGAGSACFNGQNGNTVLQVNQTLDDNADRGQIYFYRNESLIGKITSSNTQTLYTDLSDYRLKNTIAPMTGALAKVALLKPCTYKWNVDNSDGQGFIAHELAEVFPTAVSGEKDAVDSEGNPNYQGVDTSLLVATLTAALQEAHGLIKSLEARVVALEAK